MPDEVIDVWDELEDIPGAAPNCGACLTPMSLSRIAAAWVCDSCGILRI